MLVVNSRVDMMVIKKYWTRTGLVMDWNFNVFSMVFIVLNCCGQ